MTPESMPHMTESTQANMYMCNMAESKSSAKQVVFPKSVKASSEFTKSNPRILQLGQHMFIVHLATL